VARWVLQGSRARDSRHLELALRLKVHRHAVMATFDSVPWARDAAGPSVRGALRPDEPLGAYVWRRGDPWRSDCATMASRRG